MTRVDELQHADARRARSRNDARYDLGSTCSYPTDAEEQNPMRQPPLTELGTALAWLVAVSVVGALMVALAAAESKRPSQNMSRRPWDAVILLGVLAGSWLTFPDGLASSWPPAGFWRRLHVVWKPGARGTSASRQPGWSDFSQRPRSNPASRRTRTSPTGSPHSRHPDHSRHLVHEVPYILDGLLMNDLVASDGYGPISRRAVTAPRAIRFGQRHGD